MNPNVRQINYRLINENNLIIVLCNMIWLKHDNILMSSTHNEGKSVVSERFIRTLKGKTYKKWQLMIVKIIWLFE